MIPLARFALVREVPPVCGATAKKATSAPAVIIDLPPVRHQAGPARLLDVAPGRTKKVLKTWVSVLDEPWKQGAQVVAPAHPTHRGLPAHRHPDQASRGPVRR